MARLPIDPRLARMLVEAQHLGCLDEVLVIAAALSVPDVRERPAEAREAADAAHRRFAVDRSEFLGHLALWRYLEEQRDNLSSSAFRRLCEREFLHFLRIREWRDLHRQLRRIVSDLDWQVRSSTAIGEPEQLDADAIHRSVLSGLLSNIAARNGDTREFSGARGTTVTIFPGSALAKKPPAFLMAAEILETSRLFAHTVAAIDPLWAEKLAGDLVKRIYSEPHWSAKRGAAMAYEKVTLYGVTLVGKRRVTYGGIDPVASRDLFIRHALVEGDWRTDHAFFHRNRELLEAADDLEHRTRRRDIVITEDQLFDFYDERIGADCVSTRHFDTWWKATRKQKPHLLDLDPADVAGTVAMPATDYPGRWQQGQTQLDVRYRFEPGEPDDGVTVVIPAPLLDHVRPAGFDWLVPGLRSELATELIRTLPKAIRKTMAPAQRFADLALDHLTPRAEPLLTGLARELSTITGSTITAADFDPERLPDHLRMNFAVTDAAGEVIAMSRSLTELRTDGVGRSRQSVRRKTFTDWTAEGIGTLAESVTEVVAGQDIIRYPGIECAPNSDGVRATRAATPAARDAAIPAAVAVLLVHRIPSLSSKIVSSLDAAGRLALSQSPYADRDRCVADCTVRAIRDAIDDHPEVARLRTPADFAAFADRIAPEVRSAAPEYFTLAVSAMAHLAPLRGEIDRHAGSLAADDVADQLDHLIFDGFIAATPLRHLRELPRYLQGAVMRLEALPASADRDRAGVAVIDRVTQRWNSRLAEVPESRRDHVNDEAQWLVEELRVGLFAQRLKTAYPVSEKRALRTLDRLG